MKQPAFNEVGNLLLVFLSAVTAGVAAVAFMIHYYGPSGTYKSQNVLFFPLNDSKISFTDTNLNTRKSEKYIFDKIEFKYFDSSTKQWVKVAVDNDQYTQFYNLVLNEKSLSEVSDKIVRNFYRPHSATLLFQVRPDNDPSSSKTFLEVDFANESNYYRVQLRSNEAGAWAYFYHPEIYKQAIKIFATK